MRTHARLHAQDMILRIGGLSGPRRRVGKHAFCCKDCLIDRMVVMSTSAVLRLHCEHSTLCNACGTPRTFCEYLDGQHRLENGARRRGEKHKADYVYTGQRASRTSGTSFLGEKARAPAESELGGAGLAHSVVLLGIARKRAGVKGGGEDVWRGGRQRRRQTRRTDESFKGRYGPGRVGSRRFKFGGGRACI
ncbi:hypothetical protein OH76DRAFT_1133334 [Lentinus brumalis]|uniref:Uncharacterized protein n=1 Tax=Lentinus brumalis TaxID=2498619 RepID=A0A371CUM9_9APHY|nr:hypothetical protein OH76DRAFT_1133334 [Polyporus brumalis]